MSYTISPKQNTTEFVVQVKIADSWLPMHRNIYDVKDAFHAVDQYRTDLPEMQFRVIQRTESVALVLREGE